MKILKMIENFKENNYKCIFDGIGTVSIDVFVTIAENMVESTSLKRKLDSNLDSVGGDIDIITITQDGLVYGSKIDYNMKKCHQNKENVKYIPKYTINKVKHYGKYNQRGDRRNRNKDGKNR